MGSSYYTPDTSNVAQKELHDLLESYYFVINNGGIKIVPTCIGDVVFTYIPDLNIVSLKVKEISL